MRQRHRGGGGRLAGEDWTNYESRACGRCREARRTWRCARRRSSGSHLQAAQAGSTAQGQRCARPATHACSRSSSAWQGGARRPTTLFMAQRICLVWFISGWVMLKVRRRSAAGTCLCGGGGGGREHRRLTRSASHSTQAVCRRAASRCLAGRCVAGTVLAAACRGGASGVPPGPPPGPHLLRRHLEAFKLGGVGCQQRAAHHDHSQLRQPPGADGLRLRRGRGGQRVRGAPVVQHGVACDEGRAGAGVRQRSGCCGLVVRRAYAAGGASSSSSGTFEHSSTCRVGCSLPPTHPRGCRGGTARVSRSSSCLQAGPP